VEGSGVPPAEKSPPVLNVTVEFGKTTRPVLVEPAEEKVTLPEVLPKRMPEKFPELDQLRLPVPVYRMITLSGVAPFIRLMAPDPEMFGFEVRITNWALGLPWASSVRPEVVLMLNDVAV
jgi:hypothetical protein